MEPEVMLKMLQEIIKDASKEVIKELVKNKNIHPDGLTMAAAICKTMEKQAPLGSAYAYGMNKCYERLLEIAKQIDDHLNQFSRD